MSDSTSEGSVPSVPVAVGGSATTCDGNRARAERAERDRDTERAENATLRLFAEQSGERVREAEAKHLNDTRAWGAEIERLTERVHKADGMAQEVNLLIGEVRQVTARAERAEAALRDMGLPPEIREILRDVAHGVYGPDVRGRAAAAIVKRDLCPRCANTGHELLDTGGAPGVAWGTCHGCDTPPPSAADAAPRTVAVQPEATPPVAPEPSDPRLLKSEPNSETGAAEEAARGAGACPACGCSLSGMAAVAEKREALLGGLKPTTVQAIRSGAPASTTREDR